MEDEKILDLFFARSEDAIQELDRKYGPLCRSLSYNIVNSREDAEECVNDAYLGMWNAIPPARPRPLLSYLAQVVRNLSLKAYWKQEAAKRSPSCTAAIQELEACVAGRETVEGEVDARELARAIGAFLDTLTAENRVIFLRRYWFSDSGEAIARQTGLSEKAVSVRLSRIRKKMREYLAEQGGTQ